MANDLAHRDAAALIEQVVIEADLSTLTPEQRINYYRQTCESLGLNWLTKPFEYLKLNGKLTLYARKDATDQLRKNCGVSITKLERERMDDVYLVTAHAESGGRSDSAIGAVPIKGLAGEALANAFMKAETKAKRRVTLSICGLGMTDESEVGSITGAEVLPVEVAHATPGPSLPAATPKAGPSRATLAQRYAEIVDDGKKVGVDVPAYDPDWTDEILMATGRKYSELVSAAEGAASEMHDESTRQEEELSIQMNLAK